MVIVGEARVRRRRSGGGRIEELFAVLVMEFLIFFISIDPTELDQRTYKSWRSMSLHAV